MRRKMISALRGMILAAFFLLVLLAFPLVLPGSHKAEASVRSNLSSLIRKIGQSSSMMQSGERYLAVRYKGEVYMVTYVDGFLLFDNTEDGADGWRTSTMLMLNPKTLKCQLALYYYFSNGGYCIARANVNASAIRKGKKVGYQIDLKKSSRLVSSKTDFVDMCEVDLQSVMAGWDLLLFYKAGLHMKSIGFTAWPAS